MNKLTGELKMTVQRVFVLGVLTLLVVAAAEEGSAQNVKFGGYAQFWMLNQTNEGLAGHAGVENSVSGFRIRRARLNAKTDLNETFSVDVWLEFSGSSNILLDYKGIAKVSPALVFTVGQFIPPVIMNENANISSSRILFYEISDIALNLADIMGTNSYRDIGVMVGGTADIVKYGAFYGNGRGRFNMAGSGQTILNRKLGQGLIGGRVDLEPVKGLLVGGHASMNKQDSMTVSGTPVTVSSLDRSSFSLTVATDGLGLPELFLNAEYGSGKVNDLTRLSTVNDDGKQHYTFSGFYGTVGYRVVPEFHVLARYDALTQKKEALGTLPAATTKLKNWTIGATYFFMKEKTELVKLGVNYEVRGEEPVNVRNDVVVLWMQFRF
jgi:hypothetical protein